MAEEELITNPTELRQAGFRALCKALGWVNAVRFMLQFEPGAGNYTEERQALLPPWDPAVLVEKASKVSRTAGRGD